MSHKELPDEFLEQAFLKAAEYALERLPEDDAIPHTFSRRHQRRMKKVLRQAYLPPTPKRPVFLGRRYAVVLVAALLAAFGAVMSVEAWRQAFFSFFQKKYPTYSDVSYEQIKDISLPETLIKYAPTYIPEGYVLTESDTSPASNYLYYENDQDESIFFLQARLDTATFAIDTEREDFVEIDLGGQTARFLPNGGEYMLLWENTQYAFILRVNIDKDELIKIAKSTKIAE